MASLHNLICCSMIILSLAYRAECINCYYCNSANNSACLDVNMYEEEVRSRIVPVVHCETAIPSPVSHNFFCRKIIQTIFHPHRDSEVRVTRGCGWVRHETKDCYKDDNSDHLGTTCQCFEDLCNSSDKADPAGMAAIFVMLSIVLYFWR